jgi:hypothetical protein
VKLCALVTATPAVQPTQQSTELRLQEINFIEGYRMIPIDRQSVNGSGMLKYARAHSKEL